MTATSSGYALTQRDLSVLKDLGRMRYLRTSQIQTMHFPSRRVTNRRLEVLYHQDYADRFRVPVVIGEGSADYVYCLTELGEDFLLNRGVLDDEGSARPQRNGRPKNSWLLQHHLGINDFWIALEGACRNSGLRLASFIPEYYGERTEKGGFRRIVSDTAPDLRQPGGKISLIPDAVFVLERAGKQALFFLEIDRGTEKVRSDRYFSFTDKVRAYLSYYKAQGFKRWGQQFKGFRVLVVTNSEERLRSLVSATGQLGVQTLLWFTVESKVRGGNPLSGMWHLPGREGLHGLCHESS